MRIKLAVAARFGRNEWGGASVFALFMTLMLLIVAGFAIDSQRLVAEQTKLQIAADSAAHAAVYFRQTMDEDEAIAAAVDLGRGTIPLSSNPDALRPEDVQFGIWDGSTFTPKAGSTQAARVVTGNSQRRGRGLRTYLLRLSGVSILDVETQAIYASGGTGGCIYALDDKGEGVRLTGGTSIDAEECAISDGKGNHAPMSEQHTADPFSANAQIKALHARFLDIRGSVIPAQVSVTGGPDLQFNSGDLSASQTSALAAMGCTVDHGSPDWSVSCTGTEINLGNIIVDGGYSLDFNSGGNPATVYNISGRIQGPYKPVRFGSGTFNIAKGVTGSDIRFGAGSFHIGKGACGYSICDYGTIIFEGLGDYVFDAGIKVGQGATLKLGDGAYANYYYMGAGQNGNAINVEQSGRLEFGDAIGQIDGFRVDGKFANGGGACTVFPKTDNHDFSDNVYMRGAAIFGAGAYHVDGSFHLTAGGAECEEDAPAIWGDVVTMVISG
ncbi:MAG: pilus assembly protein TadG-related protein, partial [Maritimibacter sp.]